jgi:hypothetical protein
MGGSDEDSAALGKPLFGIAAADDKSSVEQELLQIREAMIGPH